MVSMKMFYTLAALYLVGLLVRLALAPWWASLPLGGDESWYWCTGGQVASGQLPCNFAHPPLWGYLLAIPRMFTDYTHLGRLFAVFFSTLAVPLLYVLGRIVFDNKVGLIAASILIVYPNHVAYSHYLWAEPAFMVIALIACCLFFYGLRCGDYSFALCGSLG